MKSLNKKTQQPKPEVNTGLGCFVKGDLFMDKTYAKQSRYLIYGLIGAILTMIGDFLLLGVDSVGAEGTLGQYIIAAEKLSYTRIGLAGSFGFVGIPITAFGYFALYELMGDKTTTLAKLYKASVYGFIAFGGAIHIICCYLVTGMKKALETGTSQSDMMTVILNEQGGYVIPCMVIFFAAYLVNVVTFIIIIAKKKTMLPSCLWLINPLMFNILLNMLGKLSTSAFWNGVACSNMSLGAIIIFTVWIIIINRKK